MSFLLKTKAGSTHQTADFKYDDARCQDCRGFDHVVVRDIDWFERRFLPLSRRSRSVETLKKNVLDHGEPASTVSWRADVDSSKLIFSTF